MSVIKGGCFGPDVSIKGKSYVHGGDINDSFCLHLNNGMDVFVKSNTVSNSVFFDAEERGLNAIASTKSIRTPTLLCRGIDRENVALYLNLGWQILSEVG